MPVTAPTTFTEAQFIAFARGELGDLSGALCMSNAGELVGPIEDTLLELGVDDLGDVSGKDAVRKARAFARVYLWRRAAAKTAGDFNFSADGGRYDREQVHQHCRMQATLAESEAAAYGFSGVARGYVDEIAQPFDPYVESNSASEWAA